MTPKFTTATDLFGTWLAEVERGEPPLCFQIAEPFDTLDVRPGRLILFGGAPGSGKTAALLQIGVDLIRANESARLLVANVEMTPGLLVDRMVSRLSGVPLTTITDRTLTLDELARVQLSLSALDPVSGRMAFLNPPYSLEHVAAAGNAFESDVIILDYLQRFSLGDATAPDRERLENAVGVLRGFCDEGAAVLVAAAVARQKSHSGSTYQGLNLASYRGSSEMEYGCDAAYMLAPDNGGGVSFKCEKNRFGGLVDIPTVFDAAQMSFSTVGV